MLRGSVAAPRVPLAHRGANNRRFRPTVTGSNLGMVVCAHPLAAQAGMRVLVAGGNAIDAGVAVAAALNVVECVPFHPRGWLFGG